MQYLAHFSFDEIEEGRSGYFTLVVTADDPDQAAEKFEAEIIRLRNTEEVMAGMCEVYLDDLVEIRSVPETAALVHFESRDAEGNILSASLLTDAEGLTGYNWVDEDEDETDGGEQEIEPFIVFERD